MSTRLPSMRTSEAAIWMCWLPCALVPCPIATQAAGCVPLPSKPNDAMTPGYLCPLLIDEQAIPGGKRQREMLDVAPGRIRAVGVVGRIEGRSEIGDLLGD